MRAPMVKKLDAGRLGENILSPSSKNACLILAALQPADKPRPMIPPTEVPAIRSNESASGHPVRSSISAKTEAV